MCKNEIESNNCVVNIFFMLIKNANFYRSQIIIGINYVVVWKLRLDFNNFVKLLFDRQHPLLYLHDRVSPFSCMQVSSNNNVHIASERKESIWRRQQIERENIFINIYSTANWILIDTRSLNYMLCGEHYL